MSPTLQTKFIALENAVFMFQANAIFSYYLIKLYQMQRFQMT
jgi:hypothetical protein